MKVKEMMSIVCLLAITLNNRLKYKSARVCPTRITSEQSQEVLGLLTTHVNACGYISRDHIDRYHLAMLMLLLC